MIVVYQEAKVHGAVLWLPFRLIKIYKAFRLFANI